MSPEQESPGKAELELRRWVVDRVTYTTQSKMSKNISKPVTFWPSSMLGCQPEPEVCSSKPLCIKKISYLLEKRAVKGVGITGRESATETCVRIIHLCLRNSSRSGTQFAVRASWLCLTSKGRGIGTFISTLRDFLGHHNSLATVLV